VGVKLQKATWETIDNGYMGAHRQCEGTAPDKCVFHTGLLLLRCVKAANMAFRAPPRLEVDGVPKPDRDSHTHASKCTILGRISNKICQYSDISYRIGMFDVFGDEENSRETACSSLNMISCKA
jgi:hypothetical protein